MMGGEVEAEERESEDGGCDDDVFLQCYGRSSRCVNSQRTCKFRRAVAGSVTAHAWIPITATARSPKGVDQPYAVGVLREGHEPRLIPPPFVGGLALRRYRSRHQHLRRRRWRRRWHRGVGRRRWRRRRCRRRHRHVDGGGRRRLRHVDGRGASRRRTFRAQPLPEPYRNRALDCAADEDGHYQSVDDAGAAVVGRHVVGRGGNRWARANLLSWNGG